MKTFLKCQGGATAIEYGLIAGMISIVMIVALTSAGGSTRALYDSIAAKLTSAIASIE